MKVSGLKCLWGAPKYACILAIRGYQLLVSPWMRSCCRFYPSCSQYALEAVARHGCIRGGWLTLKRIMRCHPLHPGGVDPVPALKNTNGVNHG